MKRLSFPLIVALAMATTAQAESRNQAGDTSSGQYLGDDVHENMNEQYEEMAEQEAHGDIVSAMGDLYRTSAEYKSAWNNPVKSDLLEKLYANYEAALVVHGLQASDMNPNARASATKKIRAHFDEELKRIDKHFEEQDAVEKLEKKLYGILADMRTIDNRHSTDSMLKALQKGYERGEDLIEEIGELTSVGEYKRALIGTYNEVLRTIKAIDQKRQIEKSKHTKGAEKVSGKGSAEIDTHGVCKIVTNSNGRRLFVSTHTDDEWNGSSKSFLKNLPEGVSAKDCPPPPKDDDDDGHRNYQERGYSFGGGEKSWKDSQREERESIGR